MVDFMEEPMFVEDDIDYCTIDGEHCHVFEDEWDDLGICVPIHGPEDDCTECSQRYN